ncbi:uncharacterized protein LOC135426494 [Drosophila montana]|uniref:uncharacterized protein LOC135426494 n=1 Tax=Drosophila montana TaxID=40370 RepID=UPI00313E9D31
MSNENNEFNADELEAPVWLVSQFLKKVLTNNLKDDQLEVLYYKMSPATVKGDHYASVMFRVSVEYIIQAGKKAAKSLIIKTMPELEGFKKEQLGESHIFQTEIGMYTEIRPKFEAILREASDDISIYAPCLYCSLEPRQKIKYVGELSNLAEFHRQLFRQRYFEESKSPRIWWKCVIKTTEDRAFIVSRAMWKKFESF